MVAEVLFAGGRLDSIVAIGAVDELSSASYRDSTYADVSIHCGSSTQGAKCGFFSDASNLLTAATVVSGETLWCHFEFYNLATISYTGGTSFAIHDSSGFPWFRATQSASTNMQLQYNSGTGASPVWTDVDTMWDWAGQTKYIVDLKITLGSPHTFEFSIAGSLTKSGSFTQALFTNAADLRLYGMYSNLGSGTAYSQILCTRDLPTIGAKVKYCRATAAGANTGWAGAYTDINEAVNSDASAQSAATAGLKTTHAMTDVTISAGSEIKAVFQWLRGKNDGTAPTNIKSVLRSGGADYSTGNITGIGTSFGPLGARYTQDPATLTNWTQTSWNAAEAGFEAAA